MLKLNIGLSKKTGESNYGSRGASINLEVEVDGALATEPNKLQDRIRQLFGMVRSSLQEELNNGNGQNGNQHSQGNAPRQNNNGSGQYGNGGNYQGDGGGSGNGNRIRSATQAQMKALNAICNKQQVNLGQLVQDRFQLFRVGDLNIKQASALIDELKSNGNQEGR